MLVSYWINIFRSPFHDLCFLFPKIKATLFVRLYFFLGFYPNIVSPLHARLANSQLARGGHGVVQMGLGLDLGGSAQVN
jgi:hypothetical protein